MAPEGYRLRIRNIAILVLSLFSATCGSEDDDVPAVVLRDYQRIFAACKQAIDSAQPVKAEIDELNRKYFGAISNAVYQYPPTAQTTFFELDSERQIFLTGADEGRYLVAVTLANDTFLQYSRQTNELEYGRQLTKTLTATLDGGYAAEFAIYLGGSDPMQMPPPDPEAPSSSPVGERYSCQVNKGRLILRDIGASGFHDSERRLNGTLEGRSLPTIDFRRQKMCDNSCVTVSGSRLNTLDELAGTFGTLFGQNAFLLPIEVVRLARAIDE